MIAVLNKFKWFYIVSFIVFGAILTISIWPVEYSLIAPAVNDNIEDVIVVESEYNHKGTFHTTSVISLNEISYLQYFLGTRMKTVSINELPDYYSNVDPKDIKVMSSLNKDDSIQTSLIVGINEADVTIDFTSYITVFLTYNHMSEDSFVVGDYIVKVNGSENIIDEIVAVECNETASFDIIRDGEAMTVTASRNEIDDSCTFGIYIKTYSEILETIADYEIHETSTGGSSGGLMQSLYVYNQLTAFDYSNGLKIGGTGTIDVEGRVGSIGGIREKIITAISNDIDIFFVPHLSDNDTDNYIKALETYNEFDTDMILVGVETFEEAITYLSEVSADE